MTVRDLPVLDLSLLDGPDSVEMLGRSVRHALEEVGFFSIVNHGIPWEQVEAVYELSQRFHALAFDVKVACEMTGSQLGYSRLGNHSRNGQVAFNEAFFMAHPRSRRTQWPPEDALPEFRATASDYFAAMDQLGHRLLPLYAIALSLPLDYFDAFFTPAMSTLRLTHYPRVAVDASDAWGIDPHTDAGFLTMLPANPVAGLWINDPHGDWFEPHEEPESFVVNSGDMIHRWSNRRLRSTLHRVKNVSDGDRYAIPFFFDPRGDTLIECLPTCTDAEHPPQFEPITYLDYINNFMSRGYEAFRRDENANPVSA